MTVRRSHSCLTIVLVSVLVMSALTPAVAQRKGQKPAAPTGKTTRQVHRTPQPRAVRGLDRHIVAALADVSAAHLKELDLKLVGFGTRHTLSATNDPNHGIGAVRQWIKSEFERYSQACGGCLTVETQSFSVGTDLPRITQQAEIMNVVATLRGTDPEAAKRIYVISGHYDSRNSEANDATGPAPGANDDGSGTSAVLEAARVLSKHKFPATIIFVAVAGEEQGLYGSQHFAEQAKKNNWDIEAELNNDTVGGNRTPGDTMQDNTLVRVFSEGIPAIDVGDAARIKMVRAVGGENDSPSRELARYIRDIGLDYLPPTTLQAKLIFRPDRYLRGGDHTSFNQQGYAAVRLTEYREDYNHQHQNPRTENGIEYGDLPKFVDFEYLANVTRLNVAVLASLASAPAPPANVRLLTKELENDSTLTWDASPQATAYEVLWRATDRTEWENVEAVGNVTRATLKRSKDNVIFAVRAVDKQGHRSLPIVPTPER